MYCMCYVVHAVLHVLRGTCSAACTTWSVKWTRLPRYSRPSDLGLGVLVGSRPLTSNEGKSFLQHIIFWTRLFFICYKKDLVPLMGIFQSFQPHLGLPQQVELAQF